MKKIFKVALVIISIGAFCAFCSSQFGEQYVEDNDGKETSIQWEYVNLRENHTQNSDVLAVLHEGDSIILTGYSYEYIGGENLPQESWTKVITEDGITGWIVTDSIQW